MVSKTPRHDAGRRLPMLHTSRCRRPTCNPQPQPTVIPADTEMECRIEIQHNLQRLVLSPSAPKRTKNKLTVAQQRQATATVAVTTLYIRLCRPCLVCRENQPILDQGIQPTVRQHRVKLRRTFLRGSLPVHLERVTEVGVNRKHEIRILI